MQHSAFPTCMFLSCSWIRLTRVIRTYDSHTYLLWFVAHVRRRCNIDDESKYITHIQIGKSSGSVYSMFE